ncbi:hypothetical protein [Synechococcus sp. MIT S9507]|uniref:hypothetical protein n=1 Tax=Synechococcus sp. MIT S9507 TaxID=3082544 RepID=UPI0039B40424
MSFTIAIQVSTEATYRVELSSKDAKAIGKDYVDPGEKWTDEAEMALQTAFESVEGEITELLIESLPKRMGIEVELKPLELKLDHDLNSISAEVNSVEVQQ